MKNEFDSKTELIEIFDNMNYKGQEAILNVARGLFYSGVYKKNVIWANFESDNDQIKKRSRKPI